MRTRLLLIVVSLTLMAFAPAPLPRRERAGDNATDVSGTWEFEVCEHVGNDQRAIRADYVIELTREQAVFVQKGGRRTLYPMHLDPTASPPAFTWKTGDRIGYVGSYLRQPDRLILVFTPGSQVAARPTDFTGKPTWKYVLRRVRR
jgi:uncharacterized protein (TIGR03067 family)